MRIIDKSVVAIALPSALNRASNGHRCLAMLANYLVDNGYACLGVVRSVHRFYADSTLDLPSQMQLVQDISEVSRPLCIIATDSTEESLIDAIRRLEWTVVWWLMAPPGLLDVPFPCFGSEDLVAVYSSFVLPNCDQYFFFQDPAGLLSHGMTDAWKGGKPRVGIYPGKAMVRVLPRPIEEFILSADVIHFDRSWPRAPSHYCQLMDSIDGLICFDPLTAVVLDAASRGIPIFLPVDPFPRESYEQFPLRCLRDSVTSNPEDFLEILSTRSSISVADLSAQLELCNHVGWQSFARLLNSLSGDRCPPASSFPVVRDLHEFSSRIASGSPIRPALNGQAVSSRLLPLYIILIRLGLAVPLRSGVNFLFEALDFLAERPVGFVLLRLTIFLPWEIKGVFLRICWLASSVLYVVMGRPLAQRRKSRINVIAASVFAMAAEGVLKAFRLRI